MASRKFKEEWVPEPLPPALVAPASDPTADPPPHRPATSRQRLFAVLWYFIRLMYRTAMVRVFPSLGRGRYSPLQNGIFARTFVEQMGGTWVFIARLASLRPDMLGDVYCRELARTRDRSEPLPLDVVRELIDAELKKRAKTFDEEFDELDPAPIHTGAFSQAHVARRKEDKRLVMVRVLRPDASDRAKLDLGHLELLFDLLDRSGYMPHMRWKDLLLEGRKIAEDQLDYRAEESELRKVARILRPRRIYVPFVYRRYTTERLLVCECVRGVSVLDIAGMRQKEREEMALWMRRNKIDRRRVCRRLFNAHLELLFEHNLFFTELLPQNVLLLRNNRLALVTLNTLDTLEASLLRRYRALFSALVSKDYTKASDLFLSLGPPLPRKDLSVMRGMVMRSLKVWESRTYIKTAPYEQKSLTAAMQRLAVSAGKCNLPVSWELSRLHFAEHMLDGSLEVLHPGLPFLKTIYNYERAAQFRTIERAATDNVTRRLRALSDLAQVGMQLAENFEFDNDYLRRRMMGFQGAVGRAGQVVKRIMGMLLRVAMAVGAVELFVYLKGRYHITVGPEQGLLGRTLADLPIKDKWTWLVVAAVVIYVLSFLRSLTKGLSAEEFRPTGSR